MFRYYTGCRRKWVYFILKSTYYGSVGLGLFPFTFNSKLKRLQRSKWLIAYGLALNFSLIGLTLFLNGARENILWMDIYIRNPSVKYIEIIALELISSLYLYYIMPGSQLFVLNAIFLSIILFSPLLSVMHFHLIAICIYRYVWIINAELLDLKQRMNSSRVRLLLQLYGQLIDINDLLTDTYDYQMTLYLGTVLTANIIISFIFIIFWTRLLNPKTIIISVMFSLALVIKFSDFWLAITICDQAEKTARETSTILKLYNEINDLDVETEQILTEFSLFCSHRRLQFFHCKLFAVNHQMGFQMLITCVLYLIFLVQFDYMNL
ncbi:putative gustatory receptor 22a [Drosophila willistoni]|uniref:putative gustatory receptor 22a n=1 Tax=Drosophila willistoni TaxID=7260 RepID=UPI001F071EF2|nr:putative gustatory receptor 22a [Drosophila willistoni]